MKCGVKDLKQGFDIFCMLDCCKIFGPNVKVCPSYRQRVVSVLQLRITSNNTDKEVTCKGIHQVKPVPIVLKTSSPDGFENNSLRMKPVVCAISVNSDDVMTSTSRRDAIEVYCYGGEGPQGH